MPTRVLVTGGTGYVGRALVPELLRRGHAVRVLARPASLGRVQPGAQGVAGNALAADDVAGALLPGATLAQLVGTAHPSPRKAAEFVAVDLAAARAAAEAAARRAAGHVVYVSVAQPAPVMRAYQAVRRQGRGWSRRAAGQRRSCARGTCWARAIAGRTPSSRSMPSWARSRPRGRLPGGSGSSR